MPARANNNLDNPKPLNADVHAILSNNTPDAQPEKGVEADGACVIFPVSQSQAFG